MTYTRPKQRGKTAPPSSSKTCNASSLQRKTLWQVHSSMSTLTGSIWKGKKSSSRNFQKRKTPFRCDKSTTSPRQTGKTTLFKWVYTSWGYPTRSLKILLLSLKKCCLMREETECTNRALTVTNWSSSQASHSKTSLSKGMQSFFTSQGRREMECQMYVDQTGLSSSVHPHSS